MLPHPRNAPSCTFERIETPMFQSGAVEDLEHSLLDCDQGPGEDSGK